MTQTVIKIIADHLRTNGFDGLIEAMAECSCELADLAPCDNNIGSCRPGYKHLTPGGESDWVISPNKDWKPDEETR